MAVGAFLLGLGAALLAAGPFLAQAGSGDLAGALGLKTIYGMELFALFLTPIGAAGLAYGAGASSSGTE